MTSLKVMQVDCKSTKRPLFDHFKSKAEATLHTSSVECMPKFASTIENCQEVLIIYNANPLSFNLGQTYTLLEMMLGLGYGEDTFGDSADKILESLKNKDKTDNLISNMKKYEAMRLAADARQQVMKEYMQNNGQKYSAADMESFASGFTSRFLSLDLRRQYYNNFFESLIPALKSNTNMYANLKFD